MPNYKYLEGYHECEIQGDVWVPATPDSPYTWPYPSPDHTQHLVPPYNWLLHTPDPTRHLVSLYTCPHSTPGHTICLAHLTLTQPYTWPHPTVPGWWGRHDDTLQSLATVSVLVSKCLYTYILFIRIKDYLKQKNVDDVDQALMGQLSKLDRYLLESQALIETRGKVCFQTLKWWGWVGTRILTMWFIIPGTLFDTWFGPPDTCKVYDSWIRLYHL